MLAMKFASACSNLRSSAYPWASSSLGKIPRGDQSPLPGKPYIVEGKVTNLTDYGCFVEIEEGVEGLVHVSEMDWTNKNIHPSKVVQVGDDVKVMILDIDEDRRRISLGIKQTQMNPWEQFFSGFGKATRSPGPSSPSRTSGSSSASTVA